MRWVEAACEDNNTYDKASRDCGIVLPWESGWGMRDLRRLPLRRLDAVAFGLLSSLMHLRCLVIALEMEARGLVLLCSHDWDCAKRCRVESG